MLGTTQRNPQLLDGALLLYDFGQDTVVQAIPLLVASTDAKHGMGAVSAQIDRGTKAFGSADGLCSWLHCVKPRSVPHPPSWQQLQSRWVFPRNAPLALQRSGAAELSAGRPGIGQKGLRPFWRRRLTVKGSRDSTPHQDRTRAYHTPVLLSCTA